LASIFNTVHGSVVGPVYGSRQQVTVFILAFSYIVAELSVQCIYGISITADWVLGGTFPVIPISITAGWVLGGTFPVIPISSTTADWVLGGTFPVIPISSQGRLGSWRDVPRDTYI
jgi:hypothetical protein